MFWNYGYGDGAGVLGAVVDLGVGYYRSGFVVVVAAGVEIAVEAGEVGAGYF